MSNMKICEPLFLLSLTISIVTAGNLTDIGDILQKNSTNQVSYDAETALKSIIPKNYDSHFNPTGGHVDVTLLYYSVPSVKFSRKEIEVEFHFVASWVDERLIQSEIMDEYRTTHMTIIIPDSLKRSFWVPWTDFTECKRCKHSMPTGDLPRDMIYFTWNGRMLAHYRDTMFFHCQYDLAFYPFDMHECWISLETIVGAVNAPEGNITDSYDAFFQDPRELVVAEGLPSEFAFDSLYVKQACSKRSFGSAGKQTEHCLQYGIRFHRIAAYYLMLIYTPSFTIVVISWISFWISVDAAAPRVALGLTSLLTLTTQFANAQKDLPPVAYVKALDVWMIMCVIMVFGSLVEFALAYAGKLQRKKAVIKSVEAPGLTIATENDPKLPKPVEVKKKEVNALDAIARIAFPVFFLLFNLAYWPYYGRGG